MTAGNSDPPSRRSDEQANEGLGSLDAAGADLTRQIDENLKRVYNAALDEPVPERLTTLLARLKANEGDKHGR